MSVESYDHLQQSFAPAPAGVLHHLGELLCLEALDLRLTVEAKTGEEGK